MSFQFSSQTSHNRYGGHNDLQRNVLKKFRMLSLITAILLSLRITEIIVTQHLSYEHKFNVFVIVNCQEMEIKERTII